MVGPIDIDVGDEWQLGLVLLVACVLAGAVAAWLLRSVAPPFGAIAGFLGGVVIAFLAASYLLYGR